ncbi:MAG: SUMF1/EgtB/PvdO family nonheme iron enzyme [Planctomycetota bacterium]
MRTTRAHLLAALVALLTATSSATAHAQQPAKAIAVDAVQPADHLGGRQYALIIGIDDYADPAVPDLTLCERDARAMHALLTGPSRAAVDPADATLLLGDQATARNIRKALIALRRAPRDATVFIYFSGHGAKEGNEAFWVTHDAELDFLGATGFPDRDVRAFIDSLPAERVVVMIDACYAAATVKGGNKSVLDFADVLARFTGQGRAFLMASGSGEEAIEAADLKHSIFTHYLLEGLRGRADAAEGGGNGDGVVVLPELQTYIDRHVAEEAAVRGGIQKPTTVLDVREPAKFRLTIDADVIARNLRETAESKARKAQRLATLESLYIDEKLTRDQAQKGLALLRADPADLDANDRKRLAYFQQVADGTLAPDRLERALGLIESPEQRAVRLAEEARERLRLEREAKERERQAKIADLLASARSNDSEGTGRSALPTLDELLRLDPNHREARRLKDKIEGYYAPDKVGDTFTNSLGMKLAYIPAGEFIMGSPESEEGRNDNEGQHRVRLTKPFLLGVTEVTQAQWHTLMGNNRSYFKGDKLPIEAVSWEDAMEFCRRLSQIEGKQYRLPTESEWEYACRAGTTTPFYFGLTITTGQANYNGTVVYGSGRSGVNREKTMPAGSFHPNAWGVHDMHGSVWEWCSDWYGEYPNGAVTDPSGPAIGERRVLRGGSWSDLPQFCRSASRRDTPDGRVFGAGFRVALDLE